MNIVHPFALVNGDQEARGQKYVPGTYDDTLTGDSIYREGDLVSVASGKVLKSIITTPANVLPLYLAGADWAQPFAKDYLLAQGVPLNVIFRDNLFVMTWQDASADGTPDELQAADKQAILQGARREIKFNADASAKCFTIRDGTTNPQVQLVDLFKGDVGDVNVQVIVRLLDPYLGA